MIYGYARCSTDEHKQDISRQERELQAAGAKFVYCEYASGSDKKREQLARVQEAMQEGDTLIATELSRFTRSVHQLCHLLEWAQEKRIIIKAGNFTVDCTADLDPMAESMLLMMGTFSQLEQRLTVARVKSGLANARAKGKSIGRPITCLKTLPSAFKMHLEGYRSGELSIDEFGALCGRSRHTIYRWLKLLENE